MQRIVVTSYIGPDLDGTACAIAYAEYLKSNGKHAIAAVFGTPHKEAQFVFRKFGITPPPSAESLLSADDHVILVDASDRLNIAPQIKTEQIIEVIDHRKIHDGDAFTNAKVQIELVGSCATLIAEKFFSTKTEISEASAALLYSAIISNTVNFQANVTTDRDQKMAEWLLTKFSCPDNYIHDMFKDKSTFDESLKEIIDHDFAVFEFASTRLGIAQLEIIETEKLVTERRGEVEEALKQLKAERELQYVFLTAIDIEKVINTFLVIDDASEGLVSESLNVQFTDHIAKRNGIMMRKTIVPLIKAELENLP